MAGGNLGALDFSLGIRDAFTKPLEDLEMKISNITQKNSKGIEVKVGLDSFNKDIESIKKGINKLQFAWDEVATAEAEAAKKNPFADTSLFDKAREQIKGIANAFNEVLASSSLDAKKIGGFFKSADFEFAMHQFTASFKAAQKEMAAQDKENEKYWNKEQRAIERATANYANIGKEFMSLSKLKSQLMNQEIASPKDEAVMQQAVRSLDQYIERMKVYKQQYLDLAGQGKAQFSVLGQGGAAMTQMLSPEYWTAKNGATEALRMLKDNWKALTAEQKEAQREAIRLFDAQVANAKTAANASKGIEQQEKKNEQAFIAEQKAIDATTERLAKLKSVFAEGWQARQNPFLTAEERNNLIAGLEQLLPKIRELQSAANAGTYSPDLFNHGDAKVQIDSLLQLTRAYEQLSKAREKEAEQARKEQQAEQKRSIDAQVANAKTAANASKGIEQQEKKNEQAFIAEQKAIDATTERLAKLKSVFAEGWQARQNPFLTAEERNNLIAGLEQLLPKIRELQSAANAGTYSPDLFNHGDAKVQIDSLLQLTRAYEQLSKAREKEAEQARKEQQAEQKRSIDAQVANAKTAANAQESLIRLQNERRQNQIRNLEQIEQKERELAELYSRLRASRDLGLKSGANVSDIEHDLQMVRELYAEMQKLRRNVPTDKGFSPIGFSASETAAMKRHMKGVSAEAQRIQSKTRSATQAARELASAFDRVHNSASKTSSVLSDIKSLFLQGGIVFGVQQMFNSVVKTGGEIEQQHIALKSILGDTSKANELFDQTKRLALESPFTFGELNRDVKQLAAFGVETDNLYDTTKRLADIASGLGVSFERLGLAYGQVKSRSWLDGKELRQFAYAGLPMLQKLSEYYNQTRGDKTYTTRDVREMITKREVSFEDVDAVIKRLTDEGGQFYNLQYVLSETLLGQYNKLKDAWDIMLGQLASGNNLVGKFFKTGIQLATAFVQSVDRLGPVLAAAFSGVLFGKLKGAFAGNIGKGILSAKGALALEYERAALAGKKLNATQREILATKRRITAQDVSILAKNKALTANDLRRLYIMRQITREQYKQAMAGIGQNVGSRGRAGAAGSLLVNGIKSGAASLFNLMGGWIGIGITAVTIAFAKWQQAKQEMQDSIDRINEEQNARYKSVDDFLTQNPVDKARSATTEKDRMAAVENYKEKLKEVAPYNAAAFEMGVSGKKSHEERIDYLSQELELVRDANDYVTRNSDRLTRVTKGDFEDTADEAKDLENIYSTIEKRLGELHIQDIQNALPRMAANAGTRGLAQELQEAINKGETLQQLIARIKGEIFSANGAKQYNTSGISSIARGLFGNGVIDGYNLPNGVDKYVADYYDQANAFKKKVEELKKAIQKEMPNVGKDPTVTEAYKQFRESLEGQMQFSPEEKEMINISLDEAFGIDNNDLQVKLADKLRAAIDQTVPEIAAKIRSGKELNKADRDKVSELMQTAADELGVKYHLFSDKLQSLLDSSHFQTTIHLAYGKDEWNDLQKRFYDNLPSVLNDKRKYQLSNVASPWTVDNNMYSARNAAKSAIDQSRNELEAERDALKRGKSTQAIVKEKQQDLQDMKYAALHGLGYDYDGELKKSNKKGSSAAASKADNEAVKSLRARLDLIKEAYATYQKYYKLVHNEAEAAKHVSAQYKDRGLSNDDVSKITSEAGYRSLTEDAISRIRDWQPRRPGEMKDRKDELIASGVKELNDIDFNNLQERMGEFSSAMSRDLDEMGRKFDNYQTIYKSTGDARLAASISGLSRDNNGTDRGIYPNAPRTGYARSLSDYLKNYLDSLVLSSSHPDKDIDYERLLGMSDKDIEQYAGGLFAADDKDKVEGFATAFKKLKEIVTDKEFQQALDTFDSLMGQVVTQAGAQARQTAKHNQNLNNLDMLREQGKISGEGYDRARAIEDATHEENMLKASDDYRRFTDNIISMTSEMAYTVKDKAIGVLYRKLEAGAITASDYAEQVASINDKMSELDGRQGAFESFLTGGVDGWLEHQLKDALSDLQLGAMLLSADPNSKEGRQAYQRGTQKLEKYRSDKAETKGWSNLDKSMQGAVKAFNDLVGALQPLVDMAGTLGNKGIAEGVGIAQKGLASGLDVGGSMTSFAELAKAGGMDKLGNVVGKAGVWGAAAGAALSIGSSLVNKFGFGAAANKQYERQEKYYKQVLSTMQDINSSLEGRVSATYGSQSIQAARKLVGNYQAEAGEARNTFYDWSQAHTLHKNHRNRMYLFGGKGETSSYLSQVNSFLRQNGYTGAEVGGDSIQDLDAKWLKMIKEDMPEAWAHMNEDAREYLDNIIEVEDETEKLKEATEKLNEVLTGMTFDGLRQSYASLLDDLSSDNDDLADNFEKSMREAILNSMIANLYKDQIEKVISDTAELAKNEEYVDRYGNIKKHTNRDKDGNLTYDEGDIASEYTADEYRSSMEAMEGITDGMVQVRDMLKDLYGWSDSGSSSMSSSIQGITEQTGDLLASYLNAIRADVSVIRQVGGMYLPQLNVTATAQLQQQTAIAANTLRNADAAESINRAVGEVLSILNAVTHDTKQVYTRVH